MIKLSIVIPSYNIEKRIERCLLSILDNNANKEEYEVIVVDSSDDNTTNILNQYCKKYPNVFVYHQPTKTPIGIARNIGVSKAVGKYVYCVDGDDYLYNKDVVGKILNVLDDCDIYYCPHCSLKDMDMPIRKINTIKDFAYTSIGTMSKCYKRCLYVQQPSYHPEDVCFHYLLLDKCKSVGCFNFMVYVYDNLPDNIGAISRTFDFAKSFPQNLLQLAYSPTLEKLHLKEEYIAGVFKNLGDMFLLRSKLKNSDVRNAWAQRLRNEYMSMMSGFYIH